MSLKMGFLAKVKYYLNTAKYFNKYYLFTLFYFVI